MKNITERWDKGGSALEFLPWEYGLGSLDAVN